MKKARTRAPGTFWIGLPGGKAAMVVVAVVLACCACLPALDPALDISQYAHTAWKVRDGFLKGYISAITQTPDGYLWLGTEFGMFRFDGVKPAPWRPPAGEPLPGSAILSLLAGRDGTLWIGTSKGLARWKDGKLKAYPEVSGQGILALYQDHEGTVWVGTLEIPSGGKLCAVRKEEMQCEGGNGVLGMGVVGLYQDVKGNLWVGVQKGFWRWRPGRPEFFAVPGEVNGILGFAEDERSGLLICSSRGVQRFVNGRIEPLSLPGLPAPFRPYRMLRDRTGGLWIATADRGLVHIHDSKVDGFSRADGLSDNYVSNLFEDREGNVWVATVNGLDLFRDYAVSSLSIGEGLSNGAPWSVLAAKDGSVWIGTNAALNIWRDGHISRFGPRAGNGQPGGKLNGSYPNSLFQDSGGRIWVSTTHDLGYLEDDRFVAIPGFPSGYVHDIVEWPTGHLWIANQFVGLVHVFEGKVVQQIPWAPSGHNDLAWVMAADPSKRGIWLGYYKGGLAWFADGRIQKSYSAEDGLGQGRVNEIRLDPRGALWVATEGGLSRIDNGRIATLTTKNGFPCDAVEWTVEDDDHFLWLYTPCGLVRVARSELDAWAADPARVIKTTVFDASEGVPVHGGSTAYVQRVTKSNDGRIWFIASDGVSIFDPRHLPFNKQPPPVHIEQVTADGKAYDPALGQRLPPLVRDLAIDYTALSLVAPEKVRFRVKLEGQDKDWREVVNDRRAYYTNLAPRHYRFRVMAANTSGVWNEMGDSLDFSIAPAYYQAAWFRLLCVAALLGLLYGLYRLRMWQQMQHFNIRLEERVGERTRIARELHDTLLQSFQGVMLKLYAMTSMVRPAEARERLEGLLEQGQQAITEGRQAVQGMRLSTVIKNDLARVLGTLGRGLAAEQNAQSPVDFGVTVEGETRDLHPILRDEVYRIASEAIRNAFRHSGARRIDVEIGYDDREVRVRILDDGKGIDQKVLDGGGREGHFGLTGMRERAKLAGGKLAVWSKLDSGTEVELTIPASRAYLKSSTPR